MSCHYHKFSLFNEFFFSLNQQLRNNLDQGGHIAQPDGLLINGLGPHQAVFNFESGDFSSDNYLLYAKSLML